MNELINFDIDSLVSKKCVCGSKINIEKGICEYCDAEYIELRNKYSDFEKLLLANINNEIDININTIEFISKIYTYKNELKSIIFDRYLEKQDILYKLQNYNNQIREKIKNSQNLNDEENKVIITMLNNDTFDPILIHQIIKNWLLKKNNISYEVFKETIRCFVKMNMFCLQKGTLSKYNVICDINEPYKDYMASIYFAGKNAIIYLNEEYLKKSYNNNNKDLLQTVFHELWYFNQSIMIENNIFQEDIYDCLKESIIRTYDSKTDSYYQQNYQLLKHEKDAQIKSYIWLLRYIAELDVELAKEDIDKINDDIEQELNEKNNNVRKFEFYDEDLEMTFLEDKDFEDVFEYCLKKQPELLKKYKMLNIEYVIDGGIIRRKTNEELLDYYINSEIDSEVGKYIFKKIKHNKQKMKSDV